MKTQTSKLGSTVKWEKRGLIYCVNNQAQWMKSHAQCPTAIVLSDRIRVYFSVRDHLGESLPTFIDLDKSDPSKILYEHNMPVIEKGRKGTFDENGIIPSYIVRKDDEILLYYAGWSRCQNVPYKNFTGLAISKDDGQNFEKVSEGPVMGMDIHNPLSATGPCITKVNDKYLCTYSTGVAWIDINGKLEHTYLLAGAISNDAIHWEYLDKILIEPENEFMAHCKPAFYYKNGIYHMWFSKRGSHDFRKSGNSAYRLGYAFSDDFVNWKRNDSLAHIDVSDKGWDSDMICYPHIIETENQYIMFYNGNGFGLSGFGYAVKNK